MKRISSSDSLGALISMCPEEQSPGSNHIYTREYQTMLEGLDEEGCIEESGHIAEKKRRLSVDQVKSLERNFEVENKLEPERKVKLAQELGLQPRQVAVWFQNRRARWKTKQLERDYGVLKANFDALQSNYESIVNDKEALLIQIKELKSKLKDENQEDTNLSSIKEETLSLETEEKGSNQVLITTQPNSNSNSLIKDTNMRNEKSISSSPVLISELKFDGSSDSDSSAILNDDHSPNVSNSSSGFDRPPSIEIDCFSFSDSTHNNVYHPQFVKMEEHNFFGGEDETCDFFSDDQAPTLQWYCGDQWT